jgi:hypothetical protein
MATDVPVRSDGEAVCAVPVRGEINDRVKSMTAG